MINLIIHFVKRDYTIISAFWGNKAHKSVEIMLNA